MIGSIAFTLCLFLIFGAALRFMIGVAFPPPKPIKASRMALD